jgi:hypothetical protein
MRLKLAAATLIASAAPALAHPGHLQEAAGHTHWIAVGALCFAGLIALTGLARSLRRRRPEANGRTAGQK